MRSSSRSGHRRRPEGYIRLLEAILEEAGYTNLKSVTDSRHALPVYDAFQPDLLLLDLTMPHLDGVGVLEQVKSHVPRAVWPREERKMRAGRAEPAMIERTRLAEESKLPEIADLVRRAQRGDSSAFQALYDEYAPAVFRFLARRVDGPLETLEDLTEVVFVKAFEKVGKYQERGLPFSAWLYRIARNHLIDHVRTLQKRPPGGPDAIEEAAGAADPRAEDAFTRMLDREMLDVALAVLGEDQRRAVQLGFLEGLSVAETALVMRRSEDAIKKLQARGLANLRRVLDPAASGRPDVTCTPALVAAAYIELQDSVGLRTSM